MGQRRRTCVAGTLLLIWSLLAVAFSAAVEENLEAIKLQASSNTSMEGSNNRMLPVNTKDDNNRIGNLGRVKTEEKENLKKEVTTSNGSVGIPINELTTSTEVKGIPEDVSSRAKPKENTYIDECDTANSCMDDKRKLIACLRVPGNDSPTLSLLIQNKGSASHTIGIHAPDFVKPEQSSVTLHAKEGKKAKLSVYCNGTSGICEQNPHYIFMTPTRTMSLLADLELVKVSIENGVDNRPLLLSAGDWRCNLSLWDMIPDSVRSSEHTMIFVSEKLSGKASFIYISLALLVIVGAGLLWIRIRQRHNLENPSYHKLEPGLPVSSGGTREDDQADGWDNSWGEGWEDEEAPTTPSNPSLNLSSRGLASRRSIKEGWKD